MREIAEEGNPRRDNEKRHQAVGNVFLLCRKVECEAEDPETRDHKQIKRERKKERPNEIKIFHKPSSSFN